MKKYLLLVSVLVGMTVLVVAQKKSEGLKATATLHSTTLTWTLGTVTGGTGTITATKVYAGLTSGSETVLATVNAPTATFVDSAVTPGGTKFYKATSVCTACSVPESGFSPEIGPIVTPLDPGQPQPPTGLTGVPQ